MRWTDTGDAFECKLELHFVQCSDCVRYAAVGASFVAERAAISDGQRHLFNSEGLLCDQYVGIARIVLPPEQESDGRDPGDEDEVR